MAASNSFDTMQVRPWTKPKRDSVDSIKITTMCSHHNNFKGFPIGLTFIDMDRRENIRIKTFVDSINEDSSKSAQVHIQSWTGQPVLYSASCVWLEICPNHRDLQCGNFDTRDDHPFEETQTYTSRHIQFPKPYAETPHVVVWLNRLDFDRDRSRHIKATASDITDTGFTIHLDTWGDTLLYGAGAWWIAYPPNCPNISSGSFNTLDLRQEPQLRNRGTSHFGKTFQTTPSVFAALNTLDIDNAANLRIKLETKNVRSSAISWSIDTWGDTVLHSAGASYLAIQDHNCEYIF